MRAHVAAVGPILPRALADYEARLAAKLREVLTGQDEERIRQEMGLFAARIDVAEELATADDPPGRKRSASSRRAVRSASASIS